MTAHAPVIGPGNGVLPRGQLYLPAGTTVAYSAPDTYQKITGTWAGRGLNFFSADVTGKLTYLGPDNTAVLFSGSSDLDINKVSTAKYALFKNGVMADGAETPVTIDVPFKTVNISITAIIVLNQNDYLEVYTQCSDGTATLNADTLSITCWGDHR